MVQKVQGFFSNNNCYIYGGLEEAKVAVPAAPEVPPPDWHTRAIQVIEEWDAKIEKALPNFLFQEKIDEIARYIEKQFEPLYAFNQWLNDNGEGEWYQKLATFLVKLPMRAVRNIVSMLYSIIREACYAVVHPLKATARLAKMVVDLIEALTRPETWSKMGAGMMSASLGQSLVTGNPISLIGIGIGGAMVVGGLAAGAFKGSFWQQLEEMPEAALTGFCMGLLIGGIQRALYQKEMQTYRVTSQEEANRFADTFIKEHGLPKYEIVELDPNGKITIHWKGNMGYFEKNYPKLFTEGYAGEYNIPTQIKVDLSPGGSSNIHIRYYGYDGFEGYNYWRCHSGQAAGWEGHLYALPPENMALSQGGPMLAIQSPVSCRSSSQAKGAVGQRDFPGSGG